MKGYIYKFTNKINNKSYIGQTIQKPNIRYYQHFNQAKKSVKNSYFHAALIKYGKEGFKFEIIEEVDLDSKKELCDKLNQLEVKYIKELKCQYPNGYNIKPGGQGYYVINKQEEPIIKSPEWLYCYCIKFKRGYDDIFFINGELSEQEANETAIEEITNDKYKDFEYDYIELLGRMGSGIEPIQINKTIHACSQQRLDELRFKREQDERYNNLLIEYKNSLIKYKNTLEEHAEQLKIIIEENKLLKQEIQKLKGKEHHKYIM